MIIILLFSGGCATSNVKSENIKTDGIYTRYFVTMSSTNKLTAEAYFTVGNSLGSDVKLNSGEQIYCNNVTLERKYAIIEYVYTATLTPAPSYLFQLVRAEETIDTAAP